MNRILSISTTPTRSCAGRSGDGSTRGAPGSDHLPFLNLYRIYFATLGLDEQRVLRLVEAEGQSYSAVATELQIGREEVRDLVQRARCKVYLGMDSALTALRAARQA